MVRYSIIIPSYGNICKLKQCLLRIKESSFKDYEIIIVNDGFRGFPEVAISKIGRIKLINLAIKKGPAYARNCGAKVSSGEILLFLDADVYIRQETIEKVNDLFKNDYYLDVVQCVYSEKPFNNNSCSQYKHFIQVMRINLLTEKDYVIGTSCLAIKKGLFNETLGFPDAIDYPGNEDRMFGLVLMEKKAKLYFAHEIQVEHDHYFSLLDLLSIDIKRTVTELTFIFSNKNQVKNILSSKKSYIKFHEICILLTVFMQILAILCRNGYLFGIAAIMFLSFNKKLFITWFKYNKSIVEQYTISFLDNLAVLLTIIFFGPVIWLKVNFLRRNKS